MADQFSKDIAQAFADNGWLLGAATAIWAFTLRLLIGRHYKAMDSLHTEISAMKEDIALIKGRLTERDRFGYHTWPGHSE